MGGREIGNGAGVRRPAARAHKRMRRAASREAAGRQAGAQGGVAWCALVLRSRLRLRLILAPLPPVSFCPGSSGTVWGP